MLSYKEAIVKFGNMNVKFVSYYKYSFSFTDGQELYITVGGSAEDIYRMAIEAGKEYTVEELGPSYIQYKGQTVYHGNW